MSMAGSGDEESCLEPPSGVVTRGVSGATSPLPSPAVTTPKRALSPLLRIFSSKEIVPRILDYEKALLVMKEHDYAKSAERPGVLKLSSLLIEPPPLCEDSERRKLDSVAQVDLNTLLSTRKDLLLLRESVSKKEDSVVSNHLREVVGMQIELIREQQEQLHNKDKELNTVRKDKEQLHARMERMERRLAILQKNSRSKRDGFESEPLQHVDDEASPMDTTPTPTRMRRAHRDVVLASSEKHSRSRSNSHDHVSRTGRSSRVSSQSGTPAPQDTPESAGSAKRTSKRKPSDNIALETASKRKRSKQTEIRTQYEYAGLNLPLPHQHNDGYVLRPALDRLSNHTGGRGTRGNSNDLASSVASPSASGYSGSEDKGIVVNGVVDLILVPSWRASPRRASAGEEGEPCEDLTDDGFTRRHRKPEDDEKRRKRWDVQRARSLRNHEELLRKYNQKGGGGEKPDKKKERVMSFCPNLSEVETIEVKDTVPVTAFGMPVPLMKPKEFELSWYLDLDTRNAKDDVCTTRNKARTSTTTTTTTTRASVGSSADEDFK